jgi:single-stranded-DNA-specific exonuclease
LEHLRPRWEVYPPLTLAQVNSIQAALPEMRLSPLVVQLLSNRDLHDIEEIRTFLNPPDVSDFPDPLLMIGVKPAIDRICKAIDDHEKIVVYGDYDADGVTSTALLAMTLSHYGASVQPYVPHRVVEGYGLNMIALKTLADGGAKLVITVDCGISNLAEAQEAASLGLDLIVTDHHHLPEELPDVICINPKQHVDGCEDFECLAGVGVAYQLVRALVKRCGKPPNMRNEDMRRLKDNLLGLVAIGTVADMAPLKGANRSLVKQGIAALPRHSLPGLPTLLEQAGVKLSSIDTERIGFVIGPRLNAAGRVDDASSAYRLLMTNSTWEASQLAQRLGAQNRRRQAVMNSIADRARDHVGNMKEDEVIVLYDMNWPSENESPLGVVGLVAGKLVEEFGRPAVVLAPGQNDGDLKGSARSTPDFDIYGALAEVSDILVHFGGHSAAAGLAVRQENIVELRRRLCELRRAGSKAREGKLQPVITADREITLLDVTDGLLEDIQKLAPFGVGNPPPLFMARNVQVQFASLVGTSHLKMIFAGGPGVELEAIAFRMGDMLQEVEKRQVDILFYVERREWRDESHLQLRVRDVRVAQQ